MTKHEHAKAVITASILLYMLDLHVTAEDKRKGSVAKVRQALRAKLRNEKNKELIRLSNKAWEDTINEYANREPRYRIYASDFIEMITMENYDALVKYLGAAKVYDIIRMCQKLLEIGIPKEIIAESREITRFMKEAISKAAYEYTKETK